MSMKNIKEIIACNLQALRKQKKLTQTEVGEAVHYSDKAVSRWEKGESLPDIETLQSLAEFFDVSIAFLCEEHNQEIIPPENTKQKATKFICVLLTILIVWLVAVFIFLYLGTYKHFSYWQIFIWAVPASALCLKYFNKIWGKEKFTIPISSILIWSFITAIYCQLIKYHLWLIFFVGAPLQAIIILRSIINKLKLTDKNFSKKSKSKKL